MAHELVRAQLEKTIKSKSSTARSLKRKEAELRNGAKELATRRKGIEAEIAEIEAHLEELGGPLPKEIKPRGKKAEASA